MRHLQKILDSASLSTLVRCDVSQFWWHCDFSAEGRDTSRKLPWFTMKHVKRLLLQLVLKVSNEFQTKLKPSTLPRISSISLQSSLAMRVMLDADDVLLTSLDQVSNGHLCTKIAAIALRVHHQPRHLASFLSTWPSAVYRNRSLIQLWTGPVVEGSGMVGMVFNGVA